MKFVEDAQVLHGVKAKDWISFLPPKSVRRTDLQSFLNSDHAALDVSTASRSRNEEFLFGTPTKSKFQLLPWKTKLPAPKESMMQGLAVASGVVGAALPAVWSVVQPAVDPFSDEKEGDKETGWCKFVPRALRFFYWSDLISAGVLLHSLYFVCDVPLRTWLAGGLMLGFPLTDAVHRVATRGNPRFKVVRLTINKIRGAADPENFQLDSVVLLNRCGAPIHRSLVDQRHEANYWFVEIREGPELVTGYQLITHRTEGAECDPVSWVVEGSVDGVNWQLVDQCNDEPMPRQRESASQQYEDLLHLPDAQAAFRQGFLAEAAACAASFAWLVLGTSWVSAGTEACVDSAPHLWYWSYFLVVVMWSSLGTVTIGLIVCAVAMIMVGSKSP